MGTREQEPGSLTEEADLDVFDHIVATAKVSKNHVLAFIAPQGSSLPLVRRRLISELRVRDISVSTVVTDPSCDLAGDVRLAFHGSEGVIVASGLEAASGSESRDYLRRTSFRRSTLSQLPCPVVLVLSEATWAWLALELPDLVRWLDGLMA